MMENHAVIRGPGFDTMPDLLTHPDDLVSDSVLSEVEKRAILADWASDARAVEDKPQLRRLDNGAFFHIGDVLNALRLLDTAAGHISATMQLPFPRRRKARTITRTFADQPDDGGPPPCAAGAFPPARRIHTIAKAVPLSDAA
jgi:hypothetical protein